MTAPSIPELPELPIQGLSWAKSLPWSDAEMTAYGRQCYAAGVEAGREAAAKVCEEIHANEEHKPNEGLPTLDVVRYWALRCAAAIRKA
jgi:hypothetical protein